MRISDWSSDVCSSDLVVVPVELGHCEDHQVARARHADVKQPRIFSDRRPSGGLAFRRSRNDFAQRYFLHLAERPRAELDEATSERRHDVAPVVGSYLERKSAVQGKRSVEVFVQGGRRYI